MATSTKKSALSSLIPLGDTIEQKNERLKHLREIALNAGFKGRYGGGLSKMLCSIADLPEADRTALAIVLQKFLN
jgi:hypothetical protein